MKGFIVAVVIFVLFVACVGVGINLGIGIYNRIVGAKQDVSKSVGDLNTEYQRRYALIDNLVSITKETKVFEKFLVDIEKEIYLKTAEAKASATKMNISMPDTVNNRIKKENELGSILTNAMDKLMVMAQHYPQITDPSPKDRNKTFESLGQLRVELKDLEANILYSRKSLNEYIRVYNNAILMFPGNLIANAFGYKEIPSFDTLEEEAKKDVKITF